MDFSQHSYYRLNKILLSATGQWPYQTSTTSRGIRIVIVIILFAHFVPQLLVFARQNGDWEVPLESIVAFIFDASMLTKYICSLWNAQEMSELMNRIRTDWQVWERDEELIILHKYTNRGRRLSLAYSVMLSSISAFYIIQPVGPKIVDLMVHNGSRPGEFPTPICYYYIDQQKYYFYIIMHACIAIFIVTLIIIAADGIFIVYVQHACGIFAMLGHKLERIGDEKSSSITRKCMPVRSGKRDVNFENVVTCIQRHNEAIEYADLIQTTYASSFFFLIGLNILGITMSGLQIVTGSANSQETTKYVICAIFAIVHLYLENYMSQVLIDHSTNLRNCIYNSEWYRLSLKARKLLIVMMIRCDVSCRLTAGKLDTMSVESFSVFMKTSLTCFTFLRSI